MTTKSTIRKASQRKFTLLGKSCERCGSTEKLQRHHRDYSSTDCVILCPKCHAKADQEDGFRQARQAKDCKVCGKSFIPSHSKNHVTCSAICLSELGRRNANKRWASHKKIKVCPVCLLEFLPNRPRTVTCSRFCGNKLAWLHREVSHRQRTELPTAPISCDVSVTPSCPKSPSGSAEG